MGEIFGVVVVRTRSYAVLEVRFLFTSPWSEAVGAVIMILVSTHELRLAVELADSIYVVGFPDETKEFATIVKHFDLKEMGLAWQEFGPKHLELVNEIDAAMMAS